MTLTHTPPYSARRLIAIATVATCFICLANAGENTKMSLGQAHGSIDRNVTRLESHVEQLRLHFAAALQQEQQAFIESLNSKLPPGVGALRVKEARGQVEQVTEQLDEAEEALEKAIARRNVLEGQLKLKVDKERTVARIVVKSETDELEQEEAARQAVLAQKRALEEQARLESKEGTRESAKDDAWRAVLAATLAAPPVDRGTPSPRLEDVQQQTPEEAESQDTTEAEMRSLRAETKRQAHEMELRHSAAASERTQSAQTKASRMAAQDKYLRQFREHDADARRFALRNLAVERKAQVDPNAALTMVREDHEEELRQRALIANQLTTEPAAPKVSNSATPAGWKTDLPADAFRYVKSIRMKGECDVRTQDGFVPIEIGQEYPLGSFVRTGNHSFVDLEFIPNSWFRVQPNTTVEITEGSTNSKRKTLYLHRGTMRVELDTLPESHYVDVETRSVAASARDARFTISYEDDGAGLPHHLKVQPRAHRFICDLGEVEIAARHERPDGRKSFGDSMVIRIGAGSSFSGVLQDSPGSYAAELIVDKGQISILHGDHTGPRATVSGDGEPSELAIATIRGTTVPAFGLDVRTGAATFAFRDGDDPTTSLERRHGAVIVTRSGYIRHHEATQMISSARNAGTAYGDLQQLRQVKATERRLESQTRRVERSIERLAKSKESADVVILNTEILAASGGLSFEGELDESEWSARNAEEAKRYAVKMAGEAERQAEVLEREAELSEAANRHRLLVQEEDRRRASSEAAEIARMEQERQMAEFQRDKTRFLKRYNNSRERERERMARKSAVYRQQMENYLADSEKRKKRREELDTYEREVDMSKLRAMESAARERISKESRENGLDDRKEILKDELAKLDLQRRDLSNSRHHALQEQEDARLRYEAQKAKYLERVHRERDRDEDQRLRLQDRELDKFRRDEERRGEAELQEVRQDQRKKGWLPFL